MYYNLVNNTYVDCLYLTLLSKDTDVSLFVCIISSEILSLSVIKFFMFGAAENYEVEEEISLLKGTKKILNWIF